MDISVWNLVGGIIVCARIDVASEENGNLGVETGRATVDTVLSDFVDNSVLFRRISVLLQQIFISIQSNSR